MNYLTIYGYDVDGDGPSDKPFSDPPFKAQLNPNSIKLSQTVTYTASNNDEQNNSQIITHQKFAGVPAPNLTLELLLDATGAIPSEDGQQTVADRVKKFKETCFFYRGSNHETPYVKLLWNGNSLFKYNDHAYFARIKNFDVNYTLFSAEGEPLRAKINATFLGTMDTKTQAKIMDKQSPDLTHVVTVKAGDTLPMLCEKIYGSRQMFHEVARVNNLLSFRFIKPGTELVFPPIK
jgi:LysM repeat protein